MEALNTALHIHKTCCEKLQRLNIIYGSYLLIETDN